MQITARLEEDTVKKLLAELLPVTIVLDQDEKGEEQKDDRWIRLDPAHKVDFVADQGLRIEVAGQLRWKTAGVPVLLTIVSAHLLIRPVVVEDAAGARLVFRPSLEKMDLKSLPGFVDSGIANMVNKRLDPEGDKLAWHFARDLANRFALPRELLEIESFTLAAGAASVVVLADAVVFTLTLTTGFERRAGGPPPV